MTAHFKGKLSLGTGHVTIKRKNIYNDAIQLYSTKAAIVDQVPILVQFDDEEGVDFGGVVETSFLVSGKRHTSKCLMLLLFLYQLVTLALISSTSLSLVRFCHMAIFVVDFFLHEYHFLCLL